MGGIKKGEKMSQLNYSLASYNRPKLSTPNGEKKLLLHSCCAPCAGEVNVRLEYKGKIVNGQGVDTDIITSSAKAYVHALNKVMENVERAHPQI